MRWLGFEQCLLSSLVSLLLKHSVADNTAHSDFDLASLQHRENPSQTKSINLFVGSNMQLIDVPISNCIKSGVNKM